MKMVLIVENKPAQAQALAQRLGDQGLDARTAASAEEALRQVANELPALVISEVELPGLNGLELCRRLRRDVPNLPILLLSARAEEDDRLAGFAAGAADYLAKPFSMAELGLRVQALLRRRERSVKPPEITERGADPLVPSSTVVSSGTIMSWGDLRIDTDRREVSRAGRVIDLARKEFNLLVVLASAPGRVFDRDSLLTRVWGEDALVDGHTVSVHVHALRRKIERSPARPEILLTVRGVGYKFSTDALMR